MSLLRSIGLVLTAASFLPCFACGDDDPDDEHGDDDDDDDDTGGDCTPVDPMIAPLDESACTADPNDYQPLANDMWPACENDDGMYHPLEQPSAAARTEAFETLRGILAAGLTPADFTAARDQYSLPEGLESRLARREDVHYPNIPEAEQDPGVAFDKQCTVLALVQKYPDRCAGPAKIQPLINQAFDNGQTGAGDPAVQAAIIDGALVWFSYLSVLKESTFSCPPADYGGDCDSGWGYYNGGRQRGGAIGFGGSVAAISTLSDNRVFDGLAAMRCWRDEYPPLEDADTSSPRYIAGRAQLDRANNHALARVIRERMVEQPTLCDSAADANWAFVQTAGQGLIKPAEDTDPAQANLYKNVLATAAPTVSDITAAVAALDVMFPCP